ncbi:glycosyltransferase [Photobacterium iliopiscarium]|jgi:glycosyltransferase involved in cell wall biosynthesis|nr:glycosyltransferase [Photobacterium iliopiscarium]
MISVILPIYNADKYLHQALDSILNQTYKEFELICLDDGSTDNSLSIINKYAEQDNRVVIVTRENKGLIYSLNEGINLAKYNYIARMDADDISHPTRFSQQIEYLKKNKDVAVIGCSYNYINEKNEITGSRKLFSSSKYTRALSLFGSPFCHPSVMFNRNVIGDDLYYDENYKYAEDYELWIRLSSNYELNNLKEILLDYRVLSTSISREHEIQQKEAMIKAIQNYRLDKKIKNTDTLVEFYLHGNNKFDFFKMILLNQKNWKYFGYELLFFVIKLVR